MRESENYRTPLDRPSSTGRVWEWLGGCCCPICGSAEFKITPCGHEDSYGYQCDGCSINFIDPDKFGSAGEKLHGFYVRALQAMEEQDEKIQGVTPEGID